MKAPHHRLASTQTAAPQLRNQCLLGFAALMIFLLLFATPPALAAKRAMLGEQRPLPPAASTVPEVRHTLDRLRQKASAEGTARLIVGVRVGFAPEGLLTAGETTLQRDEIGRAQSALVDRVPSLRSAPGRTKRFAAIPFMAVEADPDELEQLANLPEISSLEEDLLAQPVLAESVPLTGGAAAWSGGFTGAGQTVAILDTGVDKAHGFLAGKVVSEACYSSTVGAQSASSICPGGVSSSTAAGSALPYAGVCPAGKCDHGTHVAGIAAGKGASYSGVARDANLIAIQVFSRFDSTTQCGGASSCVLSYMSDQIRGLERVYALRNTYPIAAVNLSIGGGRFYDQRSCDSANSAFKTAIDNLRAANIATVVASGNNNYADSMNAPGCISSAVSVGSSWDAGGRTCNGVTTSIDQVACYSNSVAFLSLLAPGSAITSSVPGGGFSTWHGTSMATPHVAGAWALLKQKVPNLSVPEALTVLRSTGVSVSDARNGVATPRIQINTALDALGNSCGYALSTSSVSTGAAATVGTIGVTADAGCSWTATSNVAWLTITAGASGSASGTVGYAVAANTGTSSRTATLSIAGKTFTVTQAGVTVLSTGLRSPTANARDSGGDGNGYETNPTYAYATNGVSAADYNSGSTTGTSCTDSGKDRHRYYNFGLALPAGATVTGLQVQLKARADATLGSPKFCVQLSWNGGASWTTPRTTATLGTSLLTYALGSASNNWSRSWSTSDLADANFRVRLISVSSAATSDFLLDGVAVNVSYY